MATRQIKARMSCTIDIFVDTWGGNGNVDLDKLSEQVKREGLNKLQILIDQHQSINAKIIKDSPKVQFIIVEET